MFVIKKAAKSSLSGREIEDDAALDDVKTEVLGLKASIASVLEAAISPVAIHVVCFLPQAFRFRGCLKAFEKPDSTVSQQSEPQK